MTALSEPLLEVKDAPVAIPTGTVTSARRINVDGGRPSPAGGRDSTLDAPGWCSDDQRKRCLVASRALLFLVLPTLYLTTLAVEWRAHSCARLLDAGGAAADLSPGPSSRSEPATPPRRLACVWNNRLKKVRRAFGAALQPWNLCAITF